MRRKKLLLRKYLRMIKKLNGGDCLFEIYGYDGSTDDYTKFPLLIQGSIFKILSKNDKRYIDNEIKGYMPNSSRKLIVKLS